MNWKTQTTPFLLTEKVQLKMVSKKFLHLSYVTQDEADTALAAAQARIEELEHAAREALSDLLFVERVGPSGTNMQSSILRLRAALSSTDRQEGEK